MIVLRSPKEPRTRDVRGSQPVPKNLSVAPRQIRVCVEGVAIQLERPVVVREGLAWDGASQTVLHAVTGCHCADAGYCADRLTETETKEQMGVLPYGDPFLETPDLEKRVTAHHCPWKEAGMATAKQPVRAIERDLKRAGDLKAVALIPRRSPVPLDIAEVQDTAAIGGLDGSLDSFEVRGYPHVIGVEECDPLSGRVANSCVACCRCATVALTQISHTGSR